MEPFESWHCITKETSILGSKKESWDGEGCGRQDSKNVLEPHLRKARSSFNRLLGHLPSLRPTAPAIAVLFGFRFYCRP